MREEHSEDSSVVVRCLGSSNLKRPLMSFDDLLTHPESQSCSPHAFGGVKRLKSLFIVFADIPMPVSATERISPIA